MELRMFIGVLAGIGIYFIIKGIGGIIDKYI